MPLLTVIIPVYNEEKTVQKIIERLLSTFDHIGYDLQYIIIDDGSTDNTKKELTQSVYANDPRFTIIHQTKNQGKGAAIRAALPHVRGIYTIVQDADLEYFPEDIPKLLNYAKEQAVSVVYGSRNLNPDGPHGGFFFYWGGRLLTTITNILFHQKLTDEACGYKLFSSELLKSLPLTCKKFEFCPEVTGLTAKRGINIHEMAVRYAPRSKMEGKKINYRDGIIAILTLIRIKFSLQREHSQAIFIFLFILGIFLFSWNESVAGYEPDTIDAAINFTQGTYLIKKPAIGSSLFYIPFVYASRSLGTEQMMKFLTLVPPFYSALTMVIIFLIVNRLGVRRSISIAVTILIAVGSLVWPYSKIGMEYQEMFLIALILLALVHWSKKTNSSPLLIGVAVSLLALTKSYGVVFIIPTILFIIITLHQQNQLRKFFKLLNILKLIGPTTVIIAYLMIINILLIGRLSGAYNLGVEFQIVSWWDGIWGIFFGFGKSILVYSLLLVPSLFFWSKFHKKFPAVSIFILSGFALYFLITAPFSYWSDETLSVRKLIPLIPFLHFPLFWGVSDILENKKKLALSALVFLSAIAIYAQMINSFYNYFRYMIIMRSGNIDTLEQMRYNPQVSQIYINHRLFVSFIESRFTGTAGVYNYTENTWMRHFQNPGARDFALVNLNLDLNKINIPSIYFFITLNKSLKYGVLISDLLLISFAGFYLTMTTSTLYKVEEANKV